MDRFTVINGQLTCGAVVLGPSTALYADNGELVGTTIKLGVVHTTTPYRIDIVFAVDDKVVTVELKRGQDLVTSHDTRRLARQLVTMGQVSDTVVLGMVNVQDFYADLELDLVSYQMMGVVLVKLPTTPRAIVSYLAKLRPILGQTRSVLRPFAWTDIDLKRRHTGPGHLLRSIPFVGPKLVQNLLDRYGSSLVALSGTDEEWKLCGANKRVLTARREALL